MQTNMNISLACCGVEVTYAELYAKYTSTSENPADRLKPCTWYKITDFQTVDDIPDYELLGGDIVPKDPIGIVTNTSQYTVANELIAVYAIGPNQLLNQAVSLDFPTCEIWYDITYNQTSVTGAPAKGRIVRRHCTSNNIDVEFDFRGFTKAWRYDRNNDGNFIHFYDSGGDNRQLVDIADWSQIFNTTISDLSSIAQFFGHPFKTPNFVILDSAFNSKALMLNSTVEALNVSEVRVLNSTIDGDITDCKGIIQSTESKSIKNSNFVAIVECIFTQDVEFMTAGEISGFDFSASTRIYFLGTKRILADRQTGATFFIEQISDLSTIEINPILS